MEHRSTSAPCSEQPNSTAVAVPIARLPLHSEDRSARLFELRAAIECGEYHVCSASLADAMLRAVRGPN